MKRELRDYSNLLRRKSTRLRTLYNNGTLSFEKSEELRQEQNKYYNKYMFCKELTKTIEKKDKESDLYE